MVEKYISFLTIASITGMGYFRYYEYNKINKQVEDLEKQNKLSEFLLKLNEQSAFSIDTTMNSFEAYYNQFTINNYRDRLCKQCEGKVLEVCAGSNRNIKFYRPGLNLTLVDWSPAMKSVGEAKILPALQFNYKVADVTKLPFKDNSFDTVIDTFGLEYVTNPNQALKEMRRVCKKNGKIILMNEGLTDYVYLQFWENLRSGYHLLRGGYFSNRNWNKIISEFDFQIEYSQRKKRKLYLHVLKNVKSQIM